MVLGLALIRLIRAVLLLAVFRRNSRELGLVIRGVTILIAALARLLAFPSTMLRLVLWSVLS
jgi:hypothetical protein